MFSSVYNWAKSKVIYPPSTEYSLSNSIIPPASPSRPTPLSVIDEKYASDDEFIIVNTPDTMTPKTPQILTNFNDCIIYNYKENHEQSNILSKQSLPPSPIKTNEETKKNNHPDTIIDEKIGFRVLRFTRDGLIQNETNDAFHYYDKQSSIHDNISRLTISGESAVKQLNYLSAKRKQEIGVSNHNNNNKSFITNKHEKKAIKINDDEPCYINNNNNARTGPDWNKITERQSAKRALHQQRRANDKSLTKDRRAAMLLKSGGGLSTKKGKNKISMDDD